MELEIQIKFCKPANIKYVLMLKQNRLKFQISNKNYA